MLVPARILLSPLVIDSKVLVHWQPRNDAQLQDRPALTFRNPGLPITEDMTSSRSDQYQFSSGYLGVASGPNGSHGEMLVKLQYNRVQQSKGESRVWSVWSRYSAFSLDSRRIEVRQGPSFQAEISFSGTWSPICSVQSAREGIQACHDPMNPAESDRPSTLCLSEISAWAD